MSNSKKNSEKKMLLNETSVLSDFIKQKSPIVDKTKIIWELLKEPMGSYLLCRPRRFWKTLLLDTIQNIFMGNKEIFQNFAIIDENLDYTWDVFPVIRLDMLGTHSTVAELRDDLIGKLEDIAFKQEVSISTKNETRAISTLIQRLSMKHIASAKNAREDSIRIDEQDPKNVVLLIDEYDYPLQSDFLNFKKTKKVKTFLRVFFSEIKALQKYLRFVLITGITKFEQLSLSSGMNNIVDISYQPKYSEICGFTIEEIKSTFYDFIELTLKEMKKNNYISQKSSVKHLLKQIQEWYDGYSWDGIKRVLNPFSVIGCLKNKDLSEYWQRTGPSMMFDQLGIGPENYYKVLQDDLTIPNEVSISEVQNMYNDNTVMLQSGYLTISSIKKIDDSTVYELTVPNYEVKKAIIHSFLTRKTYRKVTNDPLGLMNPKYRNFYNAFCSRNENECEMLFSSFIASASYEYGLTSERFFTFLLSLCLDIGKNKSDIEVHTTKGRSDIALLTPSGEWMIIAIKHDRPNTAESSKNHQSAETVTSLSNKTVAEQPKLGLEECADTTMPDSASQTIASKVSHPQTCSKTSPVIVVSEVPEIAENSLETNIKSAFGQIVDKVYVLPFLGRGTKVWAVAVAVYDSKFVRIRFRQAVWKDAAKTTVEIPQLQI